MDITKFSLYTALAVITYLLLLAWQRDYPPTVGGSEPQVSESLSAPPLEIPSSETVPNTEIPTEVPVSTASLTTASSETASVTPPTPASRLISVSTDTFALSIDLNGGDIVYLALPQYLKELNVQDDPFVMLESSSGRRFTAESGLIGPSGIDVGSERAQYQTTASSYSLLEGDDSLSVDLAAVTDDGVRVTKRYTFTRNSYLIEISFIIDNQSSSTFQANPFGQVSRDEFPDPTSSGGFGRTFLGFVTTSEDDNYIKVELDDVDSFAAFDKEGGWIGFSQHYFIASWIPSAESSNRFSMRRNSAGQYFGDFISREAIQLQPGESGSQSIQFYAGPKDQVALAEISDNLDLTIDYGFLWFLAKPIYTALTWIDSFVGNYGVSIILLTIIVKGLFYKLSESQYRSMAGMRRLMPKVTQLKESYGDDRMKLQQATMDLYKKEKVNPLGGCLPILVQMPVFLALYWVLLESVELRHAPFFLYLQDLSVRDPYFTLPLLMGGTMFLQTLMSPAPPDPMQAKVMKLLPIMMTVIFLWFPAGLVLYWLTNAALGILQQWYITRKIDAATRQNKAAGP